LWCLVTKQLPLIQQEVHCAQLSCTLHAMWPHGFGSSSVRGGSVAAQEWFVQHGPVDTTALAGLHGGYVYVAHHVSQLPFSRPITISTCNSSVQCLPTLLQL
jgi:hypothetical protein